MSGGQNREELPLVVACSYIPECYPYGVIGKQRDQIRECPNTNITQRANRRVGSTLSVRNPKACYWKHICAND